MKLSSVSNRKDPKERSSLISLSINQSKEKAGHGQSRENAKKLLAESQNPELETIVHGLKELSYNDMFNGHGHSMFIILQFLGTIRKRKEKKKNDEKKKKRD